MVTTSTRRKAGALFAFAAMLFMGCAVPVRIPPPVAVRTPSATAIPIATDAAPEEVEVIFEISGGFTGRYQSWTVFGDGRVLRDTGQTYAVSPERVAQLLGDIAAAGFFDLDATYDSPGCADCFAYFVSVGRAGRTQSVEMVDDGRLPTQAVEVVAVLRAFVSELEP